MSLISATGLHRLPSRLQLATDLKSANRQKDAATVAAIKYATEATELQQQPVPRAGDGVMADEWNAFEQLRHAVLTEVPPEMGDGSWCLKDAWQVMRNARDFKPQYRFVGEQLDRLVREGLLRLEAGVYVPIKPVHRPAL